MRSQDQAEPIGTLDLVRTILNGDELGDLWLAWYVRRADESQAADLTQHAHDARRLSVREFCEDMDRFAEVQAMKMPGIARWKAEFERAANVEVAACALVLPDGWMLRDGNHRCCAIYLLAPPRWKVRLVGQVPPPGCLDALPGLA